MRFLVPLALALFLPPAALWLAVNLVPLPAGLEHPPAPGVLITDRRGEPLRELPAADGRFVRPPLPPGEVPAGLRDATLAAEDGRFFKHRGLDGRATARALASRFGFGARRSGGSTITQQLIKLSRPPARRRGWWAKGVETVQALRLERTWGKGQILEAYLQRLDYGNCRVGPVAAAGFYFDKTPAELSPAECAFLAALPQAPTRLNPHRHFVRAKERQEWVLQRMLANGWLDAATCARAGREPLRLRPRAGVFRAPHFVDLLLAAGATRGTASRQDTKTQAGGNGDGFETSPPLPLAAWREAPAARTTLDLTLQEFVEGEVRRALAALAGRHVADGAVVVLDNRTGDVLALVGSPDYRRPRAGQVNGAWALRSPGSALKPFTYALALEHGATPATVVADLPADYPTATGLYRPENFAGHAYGPVRLRLALANSLNLSAVRVLAEMVPGGPAALRQRLAAAGLSTLSRPAGDYGLGLTLGNAEVRLLELANAYACLARLGEFRPARLLADEPAAPGRRVGDPGAAFLIADILADNAARTPAFGAESPLRWEFPVAVKTGTSTDFRDNWAVGYTPEFTVGVWVGNFDGAPMAGVSGVSGAGPLLHAIFAHLHDTRGPLTWFTPPPGLLECAVHPVTGKRLGTATAVGVREKFLAEHPPAAEDPAHDYDPTGRVRLPASYAPWLAGGDHALTGRVVAATSEAIDPTASQLTILSPRPGATYLLDPDLPGNGETLDLRATGCASPRWECATLECHPGAATATLRPGRHQLRVVDPATGRQRETWIVVKTL